MRGMVTRDGFCGTIGHTPLIRLPKLSAAIGREIYGKAEFLNPGGSVKDRAALGIVEDFEARGLLVPGGVIVEGTAGNTGIGLALVGNARGYRTIIVMPDDQAPEKYGLLRTYRRRFARRRGGAVHERRQLLPRRAPHRGVDSGRRLGESVREYQQRRRARTHDRPRDRRADGRTAGRLYRRGRNRGNDRRHGARAQSPTTPPCASCLRPHTAPRSTTTSRAAS